MGEQSNLSIGHSPGNEPGKTKTVNAESSNAWYVNMNNGNVNTNNKTNAGRVRPVSATDKPIYDIPLSSIVHAFDVCCKNKRNTDDCIEFSFEYDTDLVAVWDAIRYGRYEPDYSKCFIRKKPVLREIFASAYVDRIIQHWADLRLDPILEERFQAQGNVRIECKGVSHTATVYLDGHEIGHHYNAYTPFSVVVSDLEPGRHMLEIKADNRFHKDSALHVPNDYMSYGGISRGVVVEELSDLYLEYVHVKAYRENRQWHVQVKAAVNVLKVGQNDEEDITIQGKIKDTAFEWKLTDTAKKYGIKFGIWIEPEFTNTKSELVEKHPDWVLRSMNRELMCGRGGTQVVLDLCNPKVQDFVFSVVDGLLSKNPEIAYIKWDANGEIMNYGSSYLPKDKQSHIYIDYHRGLINVLERIRAKYPDVVMQACGSGGGRASYGVMPYFNEFWVSDNTDALQRLFIQWGTSYFYPSIAMAQHVSASSNHQTGRLVPLKFRFDVAMTGRLGMEIQPKNMNADEKEFSKKAIDTYKGIRTVIQYGDQYRLISPYEKKAVASMMYVTENKDRAVFFAFKMEHYVNPRLHHVRLDGLDKNKKYQIRELNLAADDKPCYLHNRIFSGDLLMNAGFALDLNKEYDSWVLELTEVK